jgi:hypothetical protein
MSDGNGGRWRRLARHPPMSWARSLAQHGLDALAVRIACRLPQPSSDRDHDTGRNAVDVQAISLPPPADCEQRFDERPVEIGRHILGQQSMLMHHSMDRLDRSLLLQGRLASLQLSSRARMNSLADVEFRVSSQWGEDGIIEWLCQKIPDVPRSFIEFGVENFSEANTRFLIENRGWRGLVMDANDEHMRGLRDQPLYWRHDLTAVAALVTAENINTLITEHGFAGELGILLTRR